VVQTQMYLAICRDGDTVADQSRKLLVLCSSGLIERVVCVRGVASVSIYIYIYIFIYIYIYLGFLFL
jgi:hypothetical protein